MRFIGVVKNCRHVQRGALGLLNGAGVPSTNPKRVLGAHRRVQGGVGKQQCHSAPNVRMPESRTSSALWAARSSAVIVDNWASNSAKFPDSHAAGRDDNGPQGVVCGLELRLHGQGNLLTAYAARET